MIRAAKPQDVEQVVPLIHDAIGSIANTLAGTTDSQEALQVIGEFFQQSGNRLSYENTIVYEIDGQVVGFLIAYHGSEADALDQPFMDRIIAKTGNKDVTFTKEARDDEYYLDSVAVANTHQGQGIGKKLMQAFVEAGHAKGYSKLSLLVDVENEGAHRLYTKMGYHEDGELMVSGYHFRHMIKYC